MIAGIVACISGIVKANRHCALSPDEMRKLLVDSTCKKTPEQRIGVQPDLGMAIGLLQKRFGELALRPVA